MSSIWHVLNYHVATFFLMVQNLSLFLPGSKCSNFFVLQYLLTTISVRSDVLLKRTNLVSINSRRDPQGYPISCRIDGCDPPTYYCIMSNVMHSNIVVTWWLTEYRMDQHLDTKDLGFVRSRSRSILSLLIGISCAA